MEEAFKTGGACCEGGRGESQEGEQRAFDVLVKPLLRRLLKPIRKGEGQAGKNLDGQALSLQPKLVGLKLGATL